ncbi:MAG: 1-(5-phosphoribosyl)-5-[(5-phosphoribosylamino)methylideneamino] imidazole-4-carboxamide isomerase [Planctomycetia bacterium]|nr:1-(5-phosphoribosyl)-5-[(5-phosphoribosylamino)methylideneamino] imidazole-4-carboxamide isomerase [Planctomycetia bacterium]
MPMMQLWPAIDLRGGRCVRLLQGDYDRETVFGEDPVAQARRFVAAGARRLHLVDLDGAKSGEPVQAELIGRIVQAAGTARRYAAAGVARLVVGSIAIERPELLEQLADALPHAIVLGLDARDGRVAIRGWQATSELLAVDVARRHDALPLAGVVYTDIATDGMLGGPNLQALGEMVRAVRLPVVASGGISGAADLERAAAIGAAGCIVGRALYDGGLTIEAAARACGEGGP